MLEELNKLRIFFSLIDHVTYSNKVYGLKYFLKDSPFNKVGAILCQGARRISSILHVMGIADKNGFEKYHRVLNRDNWDPLLGAKILFALLVSLVSHFQPLIIVLDETIERRKGNQKLSLLIF